MPDSGIRRIAGRCATLLILILALIAALNDGTRELFASPQGSQKGSHLPVATQTEQEGAPLRIVSTFVETPSPERTVVRAMLQNQGGKKIRALAITAGTLVHFYNLTGRASVLTPTQIKTFDLYYTGDERPKEINVSVDFVEFDDGTTWGHDVSNSRERLAGERAGAKAEKQRLKELLRSGGRAALNDFLGGAAPDASDQPDPAGRSAAWVDGYSSGVMSMRHRARQALQTGDPDRVTLELDKPYDTSEDN